MSTRWYPIYKTGNPQLRVFLTDFWMKMVRNDVKPTPPPNVVTFHCSMEMTEHDINNYLTKIYKIPVVAVRTEVRMGEFIRDPARKYIKKKDDFRVAIITLVCSLCQYKFYFLRQYKQFNGQIIILFPYCNAGVCVCVYSQQTRNSNSLYCTMRRRSKSKRMKPENNLRIIKNHIRNFWN